MPYPMYRSPPNAEFQYQGDFLDRRLLDPMLEGHQDYLISGPYYHGYVILTQTCDLDRSREMADFITIAVVRELRDVFGKRRVENKSNATQLLRSIYMLEVNKPAFFLLPQSSKIGSEVDCVVDLRVSFSVHKSRYEELLQCRTCGMEDIYAAKMGHIAGQMFNRIAIPGWDEIDTAHLSHAEEGEEVYTLAKHVKATYETYLEKEEQQLKVLKETQSRCLFSECRKEPDTFRWVPVRLENNRQVFVPHLMCKKHATEFDQGRAGGAPV